MFRAIALVGLLLTSNWASFVRPAEPRQTIADWFTAGNDSSGFLPKQIDATPMVMSGAQGSATRPIIEFIVGEPPGIVRYYIAAGEIQVGSSIPLHGKIFNATNITTRTIPNGREIVEVQFRCVPDSEFKKLISPNGDTFFLPLNGSAACRHIRFEIASEAGGEANTPNARVTFAREIDRNSREELKPERIFIVSEGDVIRYGDYGRKIRKIVPPNKPQGISGWIEVFAEELSFPNDGLK